MPLPTLMLRGKLRPPREDEKLKKELDEWVPIEYIIEWFRVRIAREGIENRVLILKSETASGKSTLFPPELYKALVRGTAGAGIICTQPRVMTAIENVNEIMKHNSKVLRLGETIGWSTKYNKLRPTQMFQSGLLSATIGTLTQQLRTLTDEQIIAKYKYILIDETHERDLQTDMTIYMLKNLLLRNQKNRNCPFVVLMSATFDPQSFINYFSISLDTNFIWCVGETAGFDEMWDWNGGHPVANYPQAAADVVNKIVTENPDDDPARADILIFMPGRAEFITCAAALKKINNRLADEGRNVFSILQIESTAVQTQNIDFMRTIHIPVQEHDIYIKGTKYIPTRRVIISTNVAETGLTLENLKYVIDAGYNREIEYNPVLGLRALITKPAPKSRIKQRKGRAGRKFRGVFYPLYPQYVYDRLQDLQFPQILIEDVSVIFLDIINEQLKVKQLRGETDPQFLITDIDMIDVPTPDALSACIEKLYVLGFISPISPKWNPSQAEILNTADLAMPEDHLRAATRFSITKLGAVAYSFSMIPLELIRMILGAYSWGCSVIDVITIAAYLMVDSKNFIAQAEAGNDAPTQMRTNMNWVAIYTAGLPKFMSVPGILYKIRLLLADDFIHGLILFNAIKYIISSAGKNSINNLKSWCDQNYISYKTCLDFIRARDDIMEQMLAAGMEIFSQEEESLAGSTEERFMNIITKIKYCIYEGFRNNLLVKSGSTYKTLNDITVITPKLFREDEQKMANKSEYGFVGDISPNILVYKELSLKYNRKTFIYDVKVDQVSVLDGFISVDLDFTI